MLCAHVRVARTNDNKVQDQDEDFVDMDTPHPQICSSKEAKKGNNW